MAATLAGYYEAHTYGTKKYSGLFVCIDSRYVAMAWQEDRDGA